MGAVVSSCLFSKRNCLVRARPDGLENVVAKRGRRLLVEQLHLTVLIEIEHARRDGHAHAVVVTAIPIDNHTHYWSSVACWSLRAELVPAFSPSRIKLVVDCTRSTRSNGTAEGPVLSQAALAE